MKVGDLVWHKDNRARNAWGVGYVIDLHLSLYKNHVPFVTVIWPKWNTETKGSQIYLEVINESR